MTIEAAGHRLASYTVSTQWRRPPLPKVLRLTKEKAWAWPKDKVDVEQLHLRGSADVIEVRFEDKRFFFSGKSPYRIGPAAKCGFRSERSAGKPVLVTARYRDGSAFVLKSLVAK